MRKILFLFLITILFSCEKKTTYCLKCELYSHDGGIIDSITWCDKTEVEIDELVKSVPGYWCEKYHPY